MSASEEMLCLLLIQNKIHLSSYILLSILFLLLVFYFNSLSHFESMVKCDIVSELRCTVLQIFICYDTGLPNVFQRATFKFRSLMEAHFQA